MYGAYIFASDLINKMHNIKNSRKGLSRDKLILRVDSMAIMSWLMHDIGMFTIRKGSVRKNFLFLFKMNNECRKGFIEALFATKALYVRHRKYFMFFFRDPEAMKTVSKILRKDRIKDFKENGKYNTITLRTGETARVMRQYEMLNQRYKKIAKRAL